MRRTLRAEEFAGDVEGLATDHDDLLAAEQLLGNNARKTTEKMALAINDNLERENVQVSNYLSQDMFPSTSMAFAGAGVWKMGHGWIGGFSISPKVTVKRAAILQVAHAMVGDGRGIEATHNRLER